MIQHPRKVKDDKKDKVIIGGFSLRSSVGSVTMTLRW